MWQTARTLRVGFIPRGCSSCAAARAQAAEKEVRVVQLQPVVVVGKRIRMIELERVIVVAKRQAPAAAVVAQRQAHEAALLAQRSVRA